MDNVRVNYEMVKSVMERAQWYYACAKAMRTGVREIGFVENISDEENLNEEEEQYREYYKRYQARIAGYPDLDAFLERMKDQLGLDFLADLANDDECKLAERVMKQLNFVEMRRCFADSDWNAPDEEVLKKIQQRVEKHETSLEQLVKKKKKRVTTGYLYCVLTVQNAILENLSQKPIRKERKVQYTVYGEKPRMIRMWMLTIRYTPH